MMDKLAKKIFSKKYYDFVLRRYIRYKFFGFKYKCPLCRGSYSSMFSAGFDYPIFKEKKIIGAGPRENVRCPFCNSSNRERAIYLYLQKQTNNFNDILKILHVAPEKSLQKFFKGRKNIDHVSIDIDPTVGDVQMDVANIKFDDNLFDLIICCHVLEHVPDDRLAMSEFFRVLKPNGLAILQVPIAIGSKETIEDPFENDTKERIRLFGQSDHIRLYGTDYKERLESVGFQVKQFNFDKESGHEFVEKYALDIDEDLYLCTK